MYRAHRRFIGLRWIFDYPDQQVSVRYQADRMSIQIPPVDKEKPANHPTAEDGPAVAEGSLAAAEDSPVVAEGSPEAAYIVNIAERQHAW